MFWGRIEVTQSGGSRNENGPADAEPSPNLAALQPCGQNLSGLCACVNTHLGQTDDTAPSNAVACLSFAEARDAALAWRDGLVRREARLEAPTTVREAAESYLAWRRQNRKQAVDAESVIRAHVLPAFADRTIVSLTTPELQRWVEQLAATPRRIRSNGNGPAHAPAPVGADEARARRATANRIWANARAIFSHAFKDGHVKDDAAWRRVRRFRNVDEPRIRFLTDAEARALLKACPDDLAALVRGALLTGCRFGELVALRCHDMNIATKQVYIAVAKSGKARYVPLSPQGLTFFRKLVRNRKPDALVFLKADGTAWGKNHHVKEFAKAAKQAKIAAVSFHELRHTYASALARAGVDLLTISKLLGHADTRVTSRHYAHLADASLGAAVLKLPAWGL